MFKKPIENDLLEKDDKDLDEYDIKACRRCKQEKPITQYRKEYEFCYDCRKEYVTAKKNKQLNLVK